MLHVGLHLFILVIIHFTRALLDLFPITCITLSLHKARRYLETAACLSSRLPYYPTLDLNGPASDTRCAGVEISLAL